MTIRCDGRIFTVAKVAGFMGGGMGEDGGFMCRFTVGRGPVFISVIC